MMYDEGGTLYIILKNIYVYCLTDLRNLRNVLCSTISYFIPILEDIPSGAKEDQKEARHHSSAAT